MKGYGTPGGVLSAGIGTALIGLLVAALICHFLFYLVPGLLGMQTGLPLYVVGTSTYGARGGLIMPGLVDGSAAVRLARGQRPCRIERVMPVLQLGNDNDGQRTRVQIPGFWHGAIATVFIFLAAFVGLKGIQYVGRVATWLPLIPLVVLIVLVVKTAGGLASFTPDKLTPARRQSSDKAAAAWIG